MDMFHIMFRKIYQFLCFTYLMQKRVQIPTGTFRVGSHINFQFVSVEFKSCFLMNVVEYIVWRVLWRISYIVVCAFCPRGKWILYCFQYNSFLSSIGEILFWKEPGIMDVPFSDKWWFFWANLIPWCHLSDTWTVVGITHHACAVSNCFSHP